jgi:hypothetical protein
MLLTHARARFSAAFVRNCKIPYPGTSFKYHPAMGQQKEDAAIAAQVARRIAEAKAHLAIRMQAMGLVQEKGWRVLEELRNTPRGHEFVFRAIHLHEEVKLEVTVPIGPDGRPE